MNYEETIESIIPRDAAAMKESRRRWDSSAKPLYSLGHFEDMVVNIAGISRTADVDISRRVVAIMCADNGVVDEGVTQVGKEVTTVVARAMANKQSSVCVMAKRVAADILPIDIGIAEDVPELRNEKIMYGTNNMANGPAMTRDEVIRAIEVGIRVATDCAKEGYRIIATGEMGIGNTTTSSAVASVLLGCDPKTLTGRGAGLSDEKLLHKRAVVRKAIELNQPDKNDALDVVSKVGGLDIAGIAGLYLGGAANNIPVIADGVISLVSALVAVKLCPNAREYILGSHVPREPAGSMLLSELGLYAPITASLALGEGTGAVALLPLLDMALAVYRGTTFDDLEMEAYTPQDGINPC